eukprot:scaffold35308_cov32-Tisochrysis_lutea.AAC.7
MPNATLCVLPIAPRKPAAKPVPAVGHYTVQARDARAIERAATVEDVRKAAEYAMLYAGTKDQSASEWDRGAMGVGGMSTERSCIHRGAAKTQT